jgi:hypothetical protein
MATPVAEAIETEVDDTIAQMKQQIKTNTTQLRLMKQQLVATQKLLNLEHERNNKFQHVIEMYKDIGEIIQQHMREKKEPSVSVIVKDRISPDIVATQSIIDVADQVERLRYRFLNQYEKFLLLVNWVAKKVDAYDIPFEMDEGALKRKPVGTALMKKFMENQISYERRDLRMERFRKPIN